MESSFQKKKQVSPGSSQILKKNPLAFLKNVMFLYQKEKVMWIESKNTIKRPSCHVSGTEKGQPSSHLWCEKHQRVDDDGFGLNFFIDRPID